MKIQNAGEPGSLVRQKHQEDGLTLHDAAAICGVSHVLLSALENGKESGQLNKVLQVTACLGIEFHAQFRG